MNDARQLFDADGFAASLGARLVEEGEGWAVEMDIGPEHVNFLNVCHGAVMFALADIALSLISNAGREPAFAVDTSISYMRAAHIGDTLSARATPERVTRSLGWHRVEVTNQKGESVAVFSGTTYRPSSH